MSTRQVVVFDITPNSDGTYAIRTTAGELFVTAEAANYLNTTLAKAHTELLLGKSLDLTLDGSGRVAFVTVSVDLSDYAVP